MPYTTARAFNSSNLESKFLCLKFGDFTGKLIFCIVYIPQLQAVATVQ